ncbi:hypothetical protein HY570_00840 [Candidatus Micrarchaeota archaeon]|nr:hypothetical protein [Candidatus Micrarchaeota archaeon]
MSKAISRTTLREPKLDELEGDAETLAPIFGNRALQERIIDLTREIDTLKRKMNNGSKDEVIELSRELTRIKEELLLIKEENLVYLERAQRAEEIGYELEKNLVDLTMQVGQLKKEVERVNRELHHEKNRSTNLAHSLNNIREELHHKIENRSVFSRLANSVKSFFRL